MKIDIIVILVDRPLLAFTSLLTGMTRDFASVHGYHLIRVSFKSLLTLPAVCPPLVFHKAYVNLSAAYLGVERGLH